MDTAVVELDALADAVGATAQDHDLGARAGIGFALRLQHAVALVGAVHIGGVGGELGGAGVDPLIDRMHAQECTPFGDRRFAEVGQRRQAFVGEAQPLQTPQFHLPARQTALAQVRLFVDQGFDVAQEPGIEVRHLLDPFQRETVAEGLGDGQYAGR